MLHKAVVSTNLKRCATNIFKQAVTLKIFLITTKTGLLLSMQPRFYYS